MTVAAALRNVRRTVGAGLAAPLDARPSDGAPRGSVDAVLAATVTALVGFGIVMGARYEAGRAWKAPKSW